MTKNKAFEIYAHHRWNSLTGNMRLNTTHTIRTVQQLNTLENEVQNPRKDKFNMSLT
jgi:hypothetical protein